MPRPRVHSPHRLLDTAELLVAQSGPGNVTVRGLAAAAGVPNGTIYHAFGSIGALLGHVWLRAATDFLDLQTELVDRALAGPVTADADADADAGAGAGAGAGAENVRATGAAGVIGADAAAGAAVAAVIAAADAPAVFAERRPAAARMLLTVKKDQLLGPQLPADLADALLALDKRVVALLVRLADLVWGRRDGPAAEVMTTCVVDLPAAVFRRAFTSPEPVPRIGDDTRSRLAAAVRAALTVAPPPSRSRKKPV